MEIKTIAVLFAATMMIIGCGEGQEVDEAGANTQETQDENNTDAQNDDPANNSGENTTQLDTVEVPEIPELRWSLAAIDVGGVVEEIPPTGPDPTWIANDFLTNTAFGADQTLAAKINCLSYQFELERTSLVTWRIGLGEPFALDPLCTPNAPEGVVESIIGEFENIETGLDAQSRLTVTDGSGVTLIFQIVEL